MSEANRSMTSRDQGYHKVTSRWAYLVEGESVYLGEEFGEQVVADTVSPLRVDVESEARPFEWLLLCRCGVNISVRWVETAVGEDLSEVVNLAYRAETLPFALGRLVESLVHNPNAYEDLEVGPGTVGVGRTFSACNLFSYLISANIFA